NVRRDRSRCGGADGGFGEAASPAGIPCDWGGGAPALPAAVWVVERAGCEPSPIDATSAEGALTLESFIWPEQVERLELLRRAIEVARRTPATVDAASASDWLGERLARERGGLATVVFHSIMWGYMTDGDRATITQMIVEAGEWATSSEV